MDFKCRAWDCWWMQKNSMGSWMARKYIKIMGVFWLRYQLPGATRKIYDCVTSLLCWKMPIIPHEVVPWFLCHDNCISLHNLRLNKTNHWLVGQLLLQLGLAVLVSETKKKLMVQCKASSPPLKPLSAVGKAPHKSISGKQTWSSQGTVWFWTWL